MSWQEYEAALVQRLLYQFPAPMFGVRGTDASGEHRVRGRYSETGRQLDVAVYQPGQSAPFFVADAKRRGRPIAVPDVEAFSGLLADIGAELGLLASPVGFSKSAARRARHAGVTLYVMTFSDALLAKWLVAARSVFPGDSYFHPELARALHAFNDRSAPWDVVHELEGGGASSGEPLPFDDCMAFFNATLASERRQAVQLLLHIATAHVDDGWRFNAIQLLDEHAKLSSALRIQLLETERDPETIALLKGLDG